MMRALALLLALAAVPGCKSDERPQVPTAVASEQPFSRTIVAEGNLKAVKATPISAPAIPGVWRPLKLAWLIEDGTEVKKGELVARLDGTDLKKQLENGEADVASTSAKLSRERVEGRRAALARESAARLAELSLESTKKFSDRDPEIYSRNQIIESQIDEELSTARRAHAEAAKKIERGVSRSKAMLIEVERRKHGLEVTRAKAGLASLELRAPHDGLLVLQRNWRGEVPKVGDEQWPGRSLAELPDLAEMEAEIFVLEVDGGAIEADTPVAIEIESQPGRVFEGKIKSVDKLAKPRVRRVPVQYFRAVVSLEKTEPDLMKPGQRIRATIKLDETTALVIPRHAVFEDDGAKVVYVKNGDGFDAKPVELGSASAGRVVVESGIAAGDEIALANPTTKSKNGEGDNKAEGD